MGNQWTSFQVYGLLHGGEREGGKSVSPGDQHTLSLLFFHLHILDET